MAFNDNNHCNDTIHVLSFLYKLYLFYRIEL